MTRKGNLGPSPHLPSSDPPVEFVGTSAADAQAFGSVRESRLVSEPVMVGASTWSYQPSESSQVMTTAVEDQLGRDSRWLMVPTSHVCSSSGSEYPAWPSS